MIISFILNGHSFPAFYKDAFVNFVAFLKKITIIVQLIVNCVSSGGKSMAGFRVFIFILLGISTLFAVASIVLKNSIRKDKYLRGGFSALIIISIAIVIISLFIGGWSGMGYGFIGVCMFIGTILNGFIYWLINSIRNRDKKPYM
jgi:hypothetical protein